MKSCYPINIIGEYPLFPVSLEIRLPQYVIKTKAEQLQLPRIPASLCRTVLQSPARNGLLAVMLRRVAV